jgi:5-methylcytosine-specific restriction endonuclease McrA
VASDPEAGRKLRAAIERYAEEQTNLRSMHPLDAVLECFVPEEVAQREVRSLLIDLVFRYLMAAARMQIEDAAEHGASVDDHLDRFLNRHTRLTGQTSVNFRRILKQAVLTAKAERPKTERRDRLAQKQQHYFCYLCGRPITDDDEQLDHLWPHSAGGGTSRENLLRAHAACQILKQDIAMPGDAAVGRFAYHRHLPRQLAAPALRHWEEPASSIDDFVRLLDDVRASGLRVALILRQRGKCHFCQAEFRTAGPLKLVRLERDLPWWPPNTVASCEPCSKGYEDANV